MFYSICYDISDDGRRLKVMKVLKDYAVRVQYSVFEANLRPEQVKQLKKALTRLLHPEEDSLRVYPLCADCVSKVEILGQGIISQDHEIIVI
jgi:CRISPR-associated protein Cas2